MIYRKRNIPKKDIWRKAMARDKFTFCFMPILIGAALLIAQTDGAGQGSGSDVFTLDESI